VAFRYAATNPSPAEPNGALGPETKKAANTGSTACNNSFFEKLIRRLVSQASSPHSSCRTKETNPLQRPIHFFKRFLTKVGDAQQLRTGCVQKILNRKDAFFFKAIRRPHG
jgi:hypothetical protein